MDILNNSPNETEKSNFAGQSDGARKLFAYLLMTGKNLSLYPEGHSIGMNSVRQFHAQLEAFILQSGDVRIEFERDGVICQGETVQKGPSEEGTLPFTLFRDGIRWLEFNEGITLEEIQEVLSIINKYSVLTAEPEGDIVTAFWEARFDHVQYEAADFFSELSPDQMDNLSQSETKPVRKTNTAEADAGDAVAEGKPPAMDGGPAIDPAALALNHREQTALQEMIFREERAASTAHLNMLLDSLLQYQDEKEFSMILDVLSEEFASSFVRHEFEAALMILDGMRLVLSSGRIRAGWAGPLIEGFITKISAAPYLKPLEDIWSDISLQQAELFKRIFQHLNPRAVETLAHLLVARQPAPLEQMVENAIISLVHRDASCLEGLIRHSDERMAARLVPVLFRLEGDASVKYLTKLARHPSAPVRRMAIKAIAHVRGDQTTTLFEFIDDPDTSVRRVILKQISQVRNETAEDLLLQYLKNRKPHSSQTEHIVECFSTLGQCGSLRSVPFLRKTLLGRKWLAGLTKSAYREGAVLALVALRIPEAREVVEKAGRSLFPGLRRIVRESAKGYFPQSKGGR